MIDLNHLEFIWFLIAIIAFIIEILSFQLISIWFACGAVLCIPLAIIGSPVWLQIVVFFSTSIFSMCMLNSWRKRYFHPTECKSMVGKIFTLEESCNDVKGITKIGDLEWQVRSKIPLEKGTRVVVIEISGVKLIVAKEEGGNES